MRAVRIHAHGGHVAGEHWSCEAARVRADIAAVEIRLGADPANTLAAAKKILESPPSTSEMSVSSLSLACERIISASIH